MSVIYVVATPIGNLEDMSQRAVNTLANVDVIVAEDTRHSRKLLNHFKISKPLVSLHEHNERTIVPRLLQRVINGESIALISDAGTPLISDPGYHLIREAQRENLKVVPIPGPCAAIVALSAAGLPSDRFIFEGFLPVKRQQRQNYLTTLKNQTPTLIFYEAPHRVLATLQDMYEIFGSRHGVIARELTKVHETLRGDTLEKLISWLEQDPEQLQGEFVILVKGAIPVQEEQISLTVENILETLLKELPLKQAVDLTCIITGGKKNKIYQMALESMGNKKT